MSRQSFFSIFVKSEEDLGIVKGNVQVIAEGMKPAAEPENHSLTVFSQLVAEVLDSKSETPTTTTHR